VILAKAAIIVVKLALKEINFFGGKTNLRLQPIEPIGFRQKMLRN
jgi:hypothetical protein